MRRSCFPNSSSHQHGPPLLGRVRMPLRSPTSALLCSPPTPSSPSAAAPVSPRQRPTSVRRSCSSPPHRRPRKPVQRRRLFYPGSPSAGSLPRRNEGLPGAWAILFVRAVVFDPAGCNRPSPVLGAVAIAFELTEALGTRNLCQFRSYLPTAHSLAYLRIAESVTVSGARLATGRAGSPLAGRVSHPLDDKQGFMKSSHSSFLLDQPCLVAPVIWRTGHVN